MRKLRCLNERSDPSGLITRLPYRSFLSMLGVMRSALFVIVTGTMLWLIAVIVAIAIGASSHTIAICAAGLALGLLGIRYTGKRTFQKN